jgi:alkanesulfonate monooxygenase SsuD/methylene tetrahydromethanopterin reductase-like flavin-dependent oxidoreductase (luciferase family)
MPPPTHRVARLSEVVGAVRSLLAGDPVSTAGKYVELSDALLSEPRPVQESIPLMIGGNGPRLLTFAAQRADIVGVTGLRKTLADGHSHEVDWRPDSLDRMFELVRDVASASGRSPGIEALVQHVQITNDPETSAGAIARHTPGATANDLLASPFMWVGPLNEIVQQLHDYEQRWGITRYVVREPALAAAAEIIHMLHDDV